jgi:hypothetical protein
MRGPLSYEDILDREDEAAGLDPDAHRQAAADFLAWSTDPHPDDEPEAQRGELLVSAAEQLSMAGDQEQALGLLREAVATGEHVSPDVRAHLINGLLECGLGEEADKVADDLRRERPTDVMVHDLVGRAFQRADRLDQALRWFTMGTLRALGDDGDELDALLLMAARSRVRHAMGFPPDDFDLMAAGSLLADDDDDLDEAFDEE